MIRRLDLTVRMRGLVADVGVLDAPLIRNLTGEEMQRSYPVDLWLAPEGNVLTLSASPLPDGPPGEDILLDVALVDPESRKALTRLTWTAPGASEFEPFRTGFPFVPPAIPPTQWWDDLDPVAEFTDADFDALRDAGMALYAAFTRKSVDDVIAVLDYRLAEFSRAFTVDLADHRAEVREQLSAKLASPDFALEPAIRDELRVSPCADGRAYHLSRGDGSELITFAETAEAYAGSMQVYVGRVKGTWQVVR